MYAFLIISHTCSETEGINTWQRKPFKPLITGGKAKTQQDL